MFVKSWENIYWWSKELFPASLDLWPEIYQCRRAGNTFGFCLCLLRPTLCLQPTVQLQTPRERDAPGLGTDQLPLLRSHAYQEREDQACGCMQRGPSSLKHNSLLFIIESICIQLTFGIIRVNKSPWICAKPEPKEAWSCVRVMTCPTDYNQPWKAGPDNGRPPHRGVKAAYGLSTKTCHGILQPQDVVAPGWPPPPPHLLSLLQVDPVWEPPPRGHLGQSSSCLEDRLVSCWHCKEFPSAKWLDPRICRAVLPHVLHVHCHCPKLPKVRGRCWKRLLLHTLQPAPRFQRVCLTKRSHEIQQDPERCAINRELVLNWLLNWQSHYY